MSAGSGSGGSGSEDPLLSALEGALEGAERRGSRRLERRLLGYERVFEVSRRIATLDLEQALDRILHEVLALTGTRRGAVLLVDEQALEGGDESRAGVASGPLVVRAARGLEDDLLSGAGFAFSRSVVEAAVERGEAVVIENVPGSSAAARASIVSLGLEAVLAIPLVVRGRTLGALYADTADAEHEVSQRDRAVLEAFGAQAALVVENARLHASLERDYVRLRRSLEGSLSFAGLVYRSEAMERVVRLVRRAAAGDAPVLLLGETGTGKELLARALHGASRRRGRPFVAENVGALPDALADGELFGHRRGAFTGAVDSRAGLLESADGGTLLLDEVGEASPALQVKLLRFLESGAFRRLGETRERRSDVRVVAATHRDLEAEVAAGRFRADLYYRLAVFPIRVPPLRERPDDVPLLARHFLRKHLERSARFGTEGAELPERLPRAWLSGTVMDRLVAHRWPGNVRELRNVVERLAAMAAPGEGALSLEEALEAALGGAAVRSKEEPPPSFHVERRGGGGETVDAEEAGPVEGGERGDPGEIEPLEAVERRHLVRALRAAGGNRSRAARLLGLPRSTFRDRLEKLGIDPEGLGEE